MVQGENMMSIRIALACAVALSTGALAQTAPVRELSKEPITSVSQVVDLSAPGHSPELFLAAQNLIERFGVDGMVFTDKNFHPGRDIWASEGKVLLVSVFARASELGDMVAGGYPDDKAKSAKVKAAVKAALAPSSSCRLLAGTPYMAKSAKAPKPLKPATVLVRKDILDCLPGSASAPVPGSATKATIARAEMAVQISDALDRLNEKLAAM